MFIFAGPCFVDANWKEWARHIKPNAPNRNATINKSGKIRLWLVLFELNENKQTLLAILPLII